MNVTRVSEHTFEIGGPGLPVVPDSVEVFAPVVPSVTALPSSLPAPSPAPLACDIVAVPARPPTAREMLAQMRARLRDVKRELADKKKLERERDQLLRLIRAATQEIDNVRRLRSAV